MATSDGTLGGEVAAMNQETARDAEFSWDQVRVCFDQVVDLPRADQRAAVEALLPGQPALWGEVLELLAEDSRNDSILEGGLEPLAAALEGGPALVGREIGPYLLMRLLGEGGMGIVYLAERADTGQTVAIKLLRDAWISPGRRERFRAEERALSKLQHVGIARLYDAGTLVDGTPWFAMEYVAGVPVTQYWSEHRGTPAECLRLFKKICEAVLYAHGRAIIHRDLKPSNIYVTADGEVKLLDFGIAKQMDTVGEDQTQTGMRLMTPSYCAPEQRTGGDIGVFTDVYALGILLYELLTGRLPEQVGDAHEGLRFARPSKLISDLANGQSVSLSRSERGDLDVLCLTACNALPADRYATVGGLLHDVNSYLEGKVLIARPDSFFYALGKFCRRQRRPLEAMAAALLFFAGVAILFTLRLAEARATAVDEAKRANLMQQFTTNLFSGGDLDAGPARDLRVLPILDRGRQEAMSLNGNRGIQADMNQVLGRIYLKLGKMDAAGELLTSVMQERRESTTLTGRKEYAESLVDLAELRCVEGQTSEAEKLVRDGLAREAQVGGSNNSHALFVLGSVLTKQGRYDEARKVLANALAKSGSAPTSEQVGILTRMGDVEFYEGRYAQADAINRRGLALAEKTVGPGHPMVAELLVTLAQTAQNRGELAEAEKNYRGAVAIDERWYGSEHPATAANLTALANLLTSEKKYDEADAALKLALRIDRSIYGPVHSSVATALNNLGTLNFTRDRDNEAEANFREALEIWTKLYGGQHQFAGVAYANLAGVAMHRKDYENAEVMCRKAIEIYLSTLPDDHLNIAIARVKLGRALIHQGRLLEAESVELKAHAALPKSVGPRDGYLEGSRKDLVQIYTGLHKPESAAIYERELAMVH